MDLHPAPGLRPARLIRLIRRAVEAMELDLSGLRVLTEAATGAYAVTPVIAALAGASRVDAVTRSTRHGSIEQVRAETAALAEPLGVADRIEVIPAEELPAIAPFADVVTNSGHVRPIDAILVELLQPSCVVPLMFEAWEIDLGREDVDLDALGTRGIRFAGTNERHPEVDVFSYLGSMAVRLLGDAAIPVYGSRLLVLCDNPFAPYLEAGLAAAGSEVIMAEHFDPDLMVGEIDAVVVSLKPTGASVLSAQELEVMQRQTPDVILAQFWGDISREDCRALDLPIVPVVEPGVGHMGVFMGAVGPEPAVRLQAGGLKVASVLRKTPSQRTPAEVEYLDDV